MITVESDALWSELGATINDSVEILNGSELSVDVAAEIEKILLIDGTLRFEAVPGIDYKNPLLKFKDSIESGISIEKGGFGVDISDVLQGRYVIRPEMEIGRNSISEPVHRFNFDVAEGTELREDLEFMRTGLLELYFVEPVLYYNAGNRLGMVEFDGISKVEHREEIEINRNSLDGGSSSWVDFGRSGEQGWTVEGSFSRYWDGKRKIRTLHHLANTVQRENLLLFVSDDIFSYVMIEGIEERIEGNYHDFKMELQEVKTRYEEH